MKRTKLLKSAPCAAPKKSSKQDVIAVSQIVEIDGERAVEISLFYMGKLRGRYFADKDNHNAWVDGKWYTCRLKNVARLCKDMTPLKNDFYYMGHEMAWDSDEDKERAQNFLDTWSLDSYEEKLSGQKRRQALRRKAERIEQQMADIPCVPDEAEEWLDQTIFPGHILFIKKEKKRMVYSCTDCGCSSWKKNGWKHGEKTVCPKCGQPVTANSRRQEKTRKAPIVILQQYGEDWVERQFIAVCKWTAKKKDIQLFEQCRAIIPKGKCWGKVWYGLLTEADEFEQDFWDKNPSNKRFLSSYLYPGHLPEVLKCGGLERSGMDILANKREKFNVNKFITTFHKRPYLEYLAKAGLSRLVADIVDIYGWWGEPDAICTYGQNLQGALQLDGNRVNRMKQINGGLRALEWLQYEEDMGIKISQESLEYLQSKNVSLDDCEDILKELKSVNRMVNYMKKQRVAPNKLATTWRDYLRMARDEGMDTTDDIVRLPKDLKARHDQLVELINARRDAEKIAKEKEKYKRLDAQILEKLPEAARYFWENDKYMIIPAGTCEELMTEGRTLHHCVGSSDIYMNKMAAGTSWILFLRKKENLEKAYYTVEIDMKDDRILQYYSEFDRQPDKGTISKVLDKFKRSLKRGQQQARVQVPVAAIA